MRDGIEEMSISSYLTLRRVGETAFLLVDGKIYDTFNYFKINLVSESDLDRAPDLLEEDILTNALQDYIKLIKNGQIRVRIDPKKEFRDYCACLKKFVNCHYDTSLLNFSLGLLC